MEKKFGPISVYHPGLNWTRLDWMGKGHFRVKMFERV